MYLFHLIPHGIQLTSQYKCILFPYRKIHDYLQISSWERVQFFPVYILKKSLFFNVDVFFNDVSMKKLTETSILPSAMFYTEPRISQYLGFSWKGENFQELDVL